MSADPQRTRARIIKAGDAGLAAASVEGVEYTCQDYIYAAREALQMVKERLEEQINTEREGLNNFQFLEGLREAVVQIATLLADLASDEAGKD